MAEASNFALANHAEEIQSIDGSPACALEVTGPNAHSLATPPKPSSTQMTSKNWSATSVGDESILIHNYNLYYNFERLHKFGKRTITNYCVRKNTVLKNIGFNDNSSPVCDITSSLITEDACASAQHNKVRLISSYLQKNGLRNPDRWSCQQLSDSVCKSIDKLIYA